MLYTVKPGALFLSWVEDLSALQLLNSLAFSIASNLAVPTCLLLVLVLHPVGVDCSWYQAHA